MKESHAPWCRAPWVHRITATHLGVGVNVHLDNTIDDSLADLILGRTGATVEDEEPVGRVSHHVLQCHLISELPVRASLSPEVHMHRIAS